MIDFDFIPQDYHAAQSERRTMFYRSSAIAAMVSIMGVWLVSNHRELSAAEAMLAEVTLQKQELQGHLAQKNAMIEDRARLADRRRFLSQLERGAELAGVLAEISRRLPETVALTSLTLGAEPSETDAAATPPVDGAPPGTPPQPPNPARLTLTGVARGTPDVLQFTAAMEQSRLFERVQMEITGAGVWARRRVQKFEFTCELASRRGWTP